jgi:hypothetical protein
MGMSKIVTNGGGPKGSERNAGQFSCSMKRYIYIITNIISDDNFAHQRPLPSLDLSNRCSNLSTLMSQLDFAQGSSSGPFPDRLLVSIFLGSDLSRPPDLF